ncbi:putative ribosome biogenesis protein [Toxoplasma gondii ARI]|uniref:Putative ribosome biogenesis protein n=1 Tax=Toxoplasma gondii ARI TaxID=1074872 RepID=A0A139Y353_TOXGO|nr:putative ribosome biogenesis protein [Toxoplasma gondii ARI]
MTPHSHRPSSGLKQRNKPSKKSSGGPVSATAYREAQRRKEAAPGITAALRPINKQQRALVTKQKRSRQLQNLQQLKTSLRGAAACGHAALPPRVVVIVSFDEHTDSRVVFAALARQLRQDLGLCDAHPSARYNPLEAQSNVTAELAASAGRVSGVSKHAKHETDSASSSMPSSTFLFPLPNYARCASLPLRSQQRILLLPAPPPRNTLPLLDLCKCADLLLCVFSGECTYTKPAFDEDGYRFLTALKMQGVPPVVGVGSPVALQAHLGTCLSGNGAALPCDFPSSSLTGVSKMEMAAEAMNDVDVSSMSMDNESIQTPAALGGKAGRKQAAETLRFQQRYFSSEFGSDKKFCAVSLPADWQKVVRMIGGASVPLDVARSSQAAEAAGTHGDLQWRRGRGYLLALDWEILTGAQRQLAGAASPPGSELPKSERRENVSGAGEDDEAEETYLHAYGFVRGVGMTCRLPIHITGVGDFIAERIDILHDDDWKRREKRTGAVDTTKHVGPNFCQEDCEMEAQQANGGETGVQDLSLPKLDVESLTAAERAELLASMNPLQPFDPTTLEQTWPTESELREGQENRQRGKCRRIRVPKGISEYERIWYEEEVDEDEDEEHEAEEDADEHTVISEGEEMGADDEKDDEWHTQEETELLGDADEMHRAKEEMVKKRNFTIEQRAAEDLQFPDEVDTPLDVEARVRFQKYRGLKSFRTSYWNKDEDLPVDYARVVDFERFKAMSAYARGELRRLCSSNVFHGRFCRVTIPLHYHPASTHESSVQSSSSEEPRRCTKAQLSQILQQLRRATAGDPSSSVNTDGHIVKGEERKGFLVLSSLLPYECAVSVVHLQLTRGGPYEGSLKGKDELIFNCGFRRFVGRPIFSEDRGVSGSGSHTDKAKMLPFFHAGVSCVASLYAPTMYPPGSVVVFRKTEDSAQPFQVCAWGSVLNSTSNRLIIKRIVLTGYPFKVHRRKAVVRYMFFNPRDIRWFTPVELHTKKGLRGNIVQPLGTHGYMKCKFNQYVKQDDTVCMYLYKRVFPKWYPPTWGGNPALLPTDEIRNVSEEHDMEG